MLGQYNTLFVFSLLLWLLFAIIRTLHVLVVSFFIHFSTFLFLFTPSFVCYCQMICFSHTHITIGKCCQTVYVRCTHTHVHESLDTRIFSYDFPSSLRILSFLFFFSIWVVIISPPLATPIFFTSENLFYVHNLFVKKRTFQCLPISIHTDVKRMPTSSKRVFDMKMEILHSNLEKVILHLCILFILASLFILFFLFLRYEKSFHRLVSV